MQPRNQKFFYVLTVLLLLRGAGILFFSAATQNAVYFLNVAEARVLPDRYEKPIRLFGEVVRHDLREGTARLDVKFTLQDKNHSSDLTVKVVTVIMIIAIRYYAELGKRGKIEGQVSRDLHHMITDSDGGGSRTHMLERCCRRHFQRRF